MKLYALHGKLLREARRASNSLSEAELPLLWILSPSCSPRLVEGFEVRLDRSGNWSRGVFFAPEFQKTALVAINQLPVSEETLWLRVLGRNTTQQQAVNELVSLPEGHPFRRNILEILANWRINVAVGENLTSEDRELIMNLSPAYLQWREEAVEEGIQQGIQQGMLGAQRMMIENIFRVRFGVLDEELAGAIAPLLQLPSEELTRLLLTLSREEFLERFASNSDD